MQEEIKKKMILTKNNQPIKEITYQDIALLNDTLNKIQSWEETLALLNRFFQHREAPINKKKIIKDFHANSYLFNAFYDDFLLHTKLLEQQLNELKTRPKLTVQTTVDYLLTVRT